MPGREDKAEKNLAPAPRVSPASVLLSVLPTNRNFPPAPAPGSAVDFLISIRTTSPLCLQPFPVPQTSEPSKHHPLSPPASGLPLISAHFTELELQLPLGSPGVPSLPPSILTSWKNPAEGGVGHSYTSISMYVVMWLMSASLLDSHPKRGQGLVCFTYYCAPGLTQIPAHSINTAIDHLKEDWEASLLQTWTISTG